MNVMKRPAATATVCPAHTARSRFCRSCAPWYCATMADVKLQVTMKKQNSVKYRMPAGMAAASSVE